MLLIVIPGRRAAASPESMVRIIIDWIPGPRLRRVPE
jgi:hypothetical protein